jgi:hypothetical protein
MRPQVKKLIWIAPLAILGMVLFVFIGGQIVMHLWNWLLPPLFGWRELTFWQALGMLVLCRILFGGFGGSSRSHSRRHKRGGENMPPDLRERMRERMHERSSDRAGGESWGAETREL